MTESSRLSMIGRSQPTVSTSNHSNSKYSVGSTVVGFHSDNGMKGKAPVAYFFVLTIIAVC